MNYCKKCSRILDNSDATVCPYCGEPLEEATASPAPVAMPEHVPDVSEAGTVETSTVTKETEAESSANETVTPEPLVTEAVAEAADPMPEPPVTSAPAVDLDSKLDEINRRIADNKQSGPPPDQPYQTYGGSQTAPPSASYGSAPTPQNISYGSTPPPPYGSAPTPPPPSYGSAPTPPPSYSSASSGAGYSAPPPQSNGPYGAAPPRYAAAPAPAPDSSATGVGYLILAIFVPIIGLIVGVVMMNDVTPKKKRDGKNILYISLIQIGFFILMCCCLFSLAASGSSVLYDFLYYF